MPSRPVARILDGRKLPVITRVHMHITRAEVAQRPSTVVHVPDVKRKVPAVVAQVNGATS
jgi:hypothetical protein